MPLKQRWKLGNSLLAVLLAITLAVTAIICALVFWVARQSSDSFERFIIESRRQETNAAVDSFSTDVETLSSLIYNELYDTALSRLWLYFDSGLFNYSYLEQVKTVQRQVYTIEQSVTFTESVKIYLTDYRRVITSGSVLRYDAHEQPIPEEMLNCQGGNLYLNGNALLLYVSRQAGQTMNRQKVVITASISRDALRRYLQKYTPDNASDMAVALKGEEELFVASYDLDTEMGRQTSQIVAQADSGSVQHTYDGVRYLLTWKQTGLAPIKVCQITPMDLITTQLNAYNRMIVRVCSLAIALMLGLACFLYFAVRDPIQRMKRALKGVEDGDLTVRISPTWSAEFQQIFRQFNRMTAKLQHLIDQEYRLKLLNVKAELKQMRYQISPHFLYNTYFNMRAMLVDEDYELAAELAKLMGRYLRYITTSLEDEAPLEEELDHSAAYLQIQKLRFGDQMKASMQPCPPAAKDVRIPRIAIQPLIENAFEHSVRDRSCGGVIAVSIELTDNRLSVIVDDNGENASDEIIAELKAQLSFGDFDPATDSVALMNIHKRIQLLCAPGSGLFVARSPLGGFRSEIRIMEVKKHAPDADRRR